MFRSSNGGSLPVEGDSRSFLLNGQHRRGRVLWTGRPILDHCALLPSCDGILFDAVLFGHRSQARLTMLDRLSCGRSRVEPAR